MIRASFLFSFLVFSCLCKAQLSFKAKVVQAGEGWAGNSVNTVVFRKNSLCSYGNLQYIAYYNSEGNVVLGKRNINSSKWELSITRFKGNIADAHNSISIITDGDGYLHMAWNHHNNKLHYCRSIQPGVLDMGNEIPMTGSFEEKVSYPEFYVLPGGNLLFLYRDGQSGGGNLVMNRYSSKEKKWVQLHHNLIDGEKKRNAYWQAYVDAAGVIHISWTWRESADVASNHDLGYARSKDSGISWENSKGEPYQLPIRESTAEYAGRIPQKSELINQTSMYADENGNPFIASYWRDEGNNVPQYRILYNIGQGWEIKNLGFRKTAFSLSGMGTKRVPVSRPQLVTWSKDGAHSVLLIFRDEESGSKVSAAFTSDIGGDPNWELKILYNKIVGSWEPSYDTELWKKKKRLDLFVQHTEQMDSEGKADISSQKVYVVSLKLK